MQFLSDISKTKALSKDERTEWNKIKESFAGKKGHLSLSSVFSEEDPEERVMYYKILAGVFLFLGLGLWFFGGTSLLKAIRSDVFSSILMRVISGGISVVSFLLGAVLFVRSFWFYRGISVIEDMLDEDSLDIAMGNYDGINERDFLRNSFLRSVVAASREENSRQKCSDSVQHPEEGKNA